MLNKPLLKSKTKGNSKSIKTSGNLKNTDINTSDDSSDDTGMIHLDPETSEAHFESEDGLISPY